MSRTYVEWAKRNLSINGLRGEHTFLQEDCLAWLADGGGGPFDLIFLDPPTFSNSKRMDREFDVQRDHVDLIHATLKRLAPGGLLLFSTNFRKFKLDREALGELEIRDITKGTVPFDFARDPKVHACFEIRRAR
jgi:23S rRNA (guanine2445-N2)-methyltransferase / 23S rRNA (guanine2069-N7)-methyltransferase